MSVKSILRFILGMGIALGIFAFAVPPLGIPRAQLFPPAMVYGNATGKTTGVITKAYTVLSRNIFKTGERLSMVDYQFQAPYVPLLFGAKPAGSGAQVMYQGTVQVTDENFGAFKEGMSVPVRYEPTYPVISGIDSPQGGRSGAQGSGLFSGWIFWALGTAVLGYIIAGSLERFLLRESY